MRKPGRVFLLVAGYSAGILLGLVAAGFGILLMVAGWQTPTPWPFVIGLAMFVVFGFNSGGARGCRLDSRSGEPRQVVDR